MVCESWPQSVPSLSLAQTLQPLTRTGVTLRTALSYTHGPYAAGTRPPTDPVHTQEWQKTAETDGDLKKKKKREADYRWAVE